MHRRVEDYGGIRVVKYLVEHFRQPPLQLATLGGLPIATSTPHNHYSGVLAERIVSNLQNFRGKLVHREGRLGTTDLLPERSFTALSSFDNCSFR